MHVFKQLTPSLASLVALLLCAPVLVGACGDDGSDTGDSTTGTATANPTTTTNPTTTADPTGSPTGSPTSDPTGSPTSDPTGDPTGDPTTDGGAFVFDTTPPGQMVQLDRMGMPAVATAVISADLKDAYNEADPAIDVDGQFVADITKNVTALHDALDDDLAGLKLTPCAAADCVTQAAPLVVPDTLQIDVKKPAGFPNGRTLTDPVVDITLAVVLLDLSTPGQTAASLIGVNPKANDKDFLPDFPYVALPH